LSTSFLGFAVLGESGDTVLPPVSSNEALSAEREVAVWCEIVYVSACCAFSYVGRMSVMTLGEVCSEPSAMSVDSIYVPRFKWLIGCWRKAEDRVKLGLSSSNAGIDNGFSYSVARQAGNMVIPAAPLTLSTKAAWVCRWGWGNHT